MAVIGVKMFRTEEDYIHSLGRMSTLLGEAAQCLVEMFAAGISEKDRYASRLKEIGQGCDELTHSVTVRLSRSFITAIDREDIHALVTALDDVVNRIEALAGAVIMYDTQEYTSHMRALAELIHRTAKEINVVVPTVDRPRNTEPHLQEIHRLEREGDAIYHEAIGKLFRENRDPQTLMSHKDLYENLEATLDRCQNIGDLVERIAIKNG